MRKASPKKLVVFDLDDTLGHFEQVSIFLEAIKYAVNTKIKDN